MTPKAAPDRIDPASAQTAENAEPDGAMDQAALQGAARDYWRLWLRNGRAPFPIEAFDEGPDDPARSDPDAASVVEEPDDAADDR